MAKLNNKYIDFGTGDNGVSGKVLPAGHTPSNYTPVQVGSEGTDKSSAHFKGIDNALSSLVGLPSGAILPFAGSSVPAGYLLCDGSEVAQSTYPSLYAALGTTWDESAKQDGTGGNYTTPSVGNFRIPDLRGIFLRGVGTSSRADGSNDVSVSLSGFSDDKTAKNGLGNSSNSISGTTNIGHTHTLGTTNVGGGTFASSTHTHTEGSLWAKIGVFSNATGMGLITSSSTFTTATDALFGGGAGAPATLVNGTAIDGTSYTPSATGSASTNIAHSHTLGTTNVNLSNTAHSHTITGDTETVPRNVGVNFIIKT